MTITQFRDAALTFVFSPTRFMIERFQNKPIRLWNWIFRLLLVGCLVFLWLKAPKAAWRHGREAFLLYGILWLVPFSRINELVIAFYKDALQRFKPNTLDRSEIGPVARLTLLLAAYFEVAAQFGILYFCALPSSYFRPPFSSVLDAVYFSVITITTVGYGDFVPVGPGSRVGCVYELTVGVILITFAFGSYLATVLMHTNKSGES